MFAGRRSSRERSAADRLHPPGSRARRMDERRRKRRASRRAIRDRGSASSRGERRATRPTRLRSWAADIDPDAADRVAAGRRALARRDRPRAGGQVGHCSFSTSRPRRFRKPTSSACFETLRSCAPTTSASSTSPIGWTRCLRIADRVTVLRDGRRLATVRTERNQRPRTGADDRRPVDERRVHLRPAPA